MQDRNGRSNAAKGLPNVDGPGKSGRVVTETGLENGVSGNGIKCGHDTQASGDTATRSSGDGFVTSHPNSVLGSQSCSIDKTVAELLHRSTSGSCLEQDTMMEGGNLRRLRSCAALDEERAPRKLNIRDQPSSAGLSENSIRNQKFQLNEQSTALSLNVVGLNRHKSSTADSSTPVDVSQPYLSGQGSDRSVAHLAPPGMNFHQPERGDLRQLEQSRMRQPRRRTRAGSLDGGYATLDPNGQLTMNFSRAAWTLSDFDQKFNKSNSTSIVEPKIMGDNEIVPVGLPSSIELPASGHDSAGGISVFRRVASSFRVNRVDKQEQRFGGWHRLADVDHRCPDTEAKSSKRMGSFCAPPKSASRRPSVSHSINSMASSMDSFYVGVARSLRQAVGNRRVGRSAENGKTISSDENGDEQNADEVVSCINMACLRQFIPSLEWLPNYKLSYTWGDLAAGLAVAVLNISTSLSAAVVAETDLSVAFRASIINTFIYALFCSSRHTSFGSWSIMSQMLLVSVDRALSDELMLDRLNLGPMASWQPEQYERWHLDIIIMYTFLIGLVQLACGLLNLGKVLASFIPEALSSSLITATAFTMAVDQLANMCGTSNKFLWSIERNTTQVWANVKDPPVSITDLFAGLFRWISELLLILKYYDHINVICVLISVSSVILLLFNQSVLQPKLERIFQRKIFLPIELFLLIIFIAISYALDLPSAYNVTTCGPIHVTISTPNIPDLRLIRELWHQSLATALISYTMCCIMAKTYSNKFNYEVDCNQELIACGAGNLIGGLFDALPATASFSRTAGQVEAGGQTQMASIVNCIALVAISYVFGHYAAYLPTCVMSACLFFGFVRMMARFTEVFDYWRVCKVDFAIWVVTFIAILTLDMINGFVYGFIFSILTMLYRAQNRRCYMLGTIATSDVYVPLVKYPMAKEIDGIKIFQYCGPIHYACADLFERLLRQKTRVSVKQVLSELREQDMAKFNPRDMDLPSHIIIDFSMISFIDSAGIHVIRKIIEDHQRINVIIFMAALASHVAAVVKNEPSLWSVYKSRFYISLADAVHCAMRDNHLIRSASNQPYDRPTVSDAQVILTIQHGRS